MKSTPESGGGATDFRGEARELVLASGIPNGSNGLIANLRITVKVKSKNDKRYYNYIKKSREIDEKIERK